MRKRKSIIYKILTLTFLVVSLPVALFLLNQETSFFNRAYESFTATEANITIDMSQPVSGRNNWGYFAQGGEESDGMLETVTDQVRRLSPKYIRIDHVFDFYGVVQRDTSGQLVFDFSKLDREIAAITKTGAKPFISLSYMPPVLTGGSEVDTPQNWTEWQTVVRRTIEHISGNQGLRISDVYYEVWNEPDLFGGFKAYGDKNYLTLYFHAAKGAEAASNVLSFKFGGPATTALYRTWFDNLLKFAAEENLRLDFYSWHRYSENMGDFEKDAHEALEWVSAHPKFANIPFLITETGPDPKNNPVYDLPKSAVHSLAVYASTFGKIEQVYLFELKDGPGPEKLWGRWGILTHEKHGSPTTKPRYQAMEFINRIRGDNIPVLTMGNGTWVKTNSFFNPQENTLRILIVNYDRFESHAETVPINIIGVPFDKFLYKRTDFLGGSKQQDVTLDGNSWQTSEIMPPNSAAIIELVGEIE